MIGWCCISNVVSLFLQDVLQVSSVWAVLRSVCVRTGACVTLRAADASVPAAGRDPHVNWVSDSDLHASVSLFTVRGNTWNIQPVCS